MLKWKDHLEALTVDGRIILKLGVKQHPAGVWAGFIWLRKGTNGWLYEYANEREVSVSHSVVDVGSNHLWYGVV